MEFIDGLYTAAVVVAVAVIWGVRDYRRFRKSSKREQKDDIQHPI
jgi:negative regulator of sigma E activity